MSKTNFGKELRKLMIDKDENLVDLSILFGVTIPFVSSVLNGNKNVPDTWFEPIKVHYGLTDEQIGKMRILAEESKSLIKIDLSKCSDRQRGLAVQLQRNLSNLNKDDIEKIEKILKGGD